MSTPPARDASAFAVNPELILLALGVLATILIIAIFVWLIRGMIREDALYNEQADSDSEDSS